jgi:hypothetical protein
MGDGVQSRLNLHSMCCMQIELLVELRLYVLTPNMHGLRLEPIEHESLRSRGLYSILDYSEAWSRQDPIGPGQMHMPWDPRLMSGPWLNAHKQC